jgi:hypothetical protein
MTDKKEQNSPPTKNRRGRLMIKHNVWDGLAHSENHFQNFNFQI